jgi:hypothetical protein
MIRTRRKLASCQSAPATRRFFFDIDGVLLRRRHSGIFDALVGLASGWNLRRHASVETITSAR